MVIHLQKLFDKGRHTVLFIDPSASHLSYTMADLDLDKKTFDIFYSSQIWTKPKWSRGQRFRYMQTCINFLVEGKAGSLPKACVTESFFSNPKQMFGSSVVPTINSFLEMAASKNGVVYQEFGASTWRSILQIKAVMTNGKRDYKTPTLDYVEKILGKMPETVVSNITGKDRDFPNDVSDCLAIALAFAKFNGVEKAQLFGATFYPKSYLEQFTELSKEIDNEF